MTPRRITSARTVAANGLACAAAAAFVTTATALPAFAYGATPARGADHIALIERDEQLEATGIGVLDAPPTFVEAALRDYEGRTGAMPFLSEIRVIRETANEDVVYNRTSIPFIGDRDYTLRIRYERMVVRGKTVHLIRYTDANELGPPPRAGVRRVRANAAWWKLEPIDGGERTLATYFLSVERDLVPRVLERAVTNELMTSTFKVLRRRVLRVDLR